MYDVTGEAPTEASQKIELHLHQPYPDVHGITACFRFSGRSIMPGRQPAPSDFPSDLQLAITAPSSSHQAVNVLILLHGLGDSNKSFTTLASQLSLPETACISLQAPTPLPFEIGGFHWGDDIVFDQATGRMDLDTGFEKAGRTITEEVIKKALIEKCGYQLREILLFGFGQGGMAALAASALMAEELGGVISVGGPLPSMTSMTSSGAARFKSPVLIIGGSTNTLVTKSAMTNLKSAFESVQYTKYTRVGDSMPRNREEMLPVMQFFARRLQSRRGVPQGSVEVT